MRTVSAENLTSEAFARFGQVIEASTERPSIQINSGTCSKYSNLALPDCTMAGGRTAMHIYRARPLELPIVVKSFERHVCGSQAFMPLNGRPYLVVVAAIGEFDLKTVRVFRAEGNQGVQYNRGIWHHFCLALEAESEFLVIDRLSSSPDCDEVHLPIEQQFRIEF